MQRFQVRSQLAGVKAPCAHSYVNRQLKKLFSPKLELHLYGVVVLFASTFGGGRRIRHVVGGSDCIS